MKKKIFNIALVAMTALLLFGCGKKRKLRKKLRKQ